MDWESDTRTLYNEIIRNIPQPIKLIAAPAISRAAEKHAERDGRSLVTRQDVLAGIFQVVPQSYRARVMFNLTSMGIDFRDSMLAGDGAAPEKTNLKQLLDTIRVLGQQMEVVVDEAKTKSVLELYAWFFRNSPLSINIPTKPPGTRTISVRYLETQKDHTPDPLTTAVVNGLMSPEKTPLTLLLEEVKRKFIILGYGVDINVSLGLSRLWAILSPASLESIMELEHLPVSARKCVPHFKKFGLTRFFIMGFDVVHQTIELYVMIREPSCVPPFKYDELLTDLKFRPVSPVVLEHCTRANIVHFTFSWNRTPPECVCFTTLSSRKADVPAYFHPLIGECIENPLFANGQDNFILGTSVSRYESHFIIGNDHNGCMVDEILKGSRAGV